MPKKSSRKRNAETVTTSEGLQYHLQIKPGDLAETVLMPGDPKRVEKIAVQWDVSKKLAEYRQYVTYTGKYKGIDISAVSSGIGTAACEIAFAEMKNVGVKNLIRVGSCGTLHEEINLGDLIISEGAVRLEDTSNHYVMKEYPAIASRMVTSALIRACEENNLPYHVGITASSSSFYVGQGREYRNYLPSHRKTLVEDLKAANVLNFEMEASLLFIMGTLFKVETGAVCAVFANRATNEFDTKGEVEAILAASEAAKIIDDYIADKSDKKYWY